MKWLRLFLLLGALVAFGCSGPPSATPEGESAAGDAATDEVDEAQEAAAVAEE